MVENNPGIREVHLGDKEAEIASLTQTISTTFDEMDRAASQGYGASQEQVDIYAKSIALRTALSTPEEHSVFTEDDVQTPSLMDRNTA